MLTEEMTRKIIEEAKAELPPEELALMEQEQAESRQRLKDLIATLPPDIRLAELTPEQILSEFTPEQILSGLNEEQREALLKALSQQDKAKSKGKKKGQA